MRQSLISWHVSCTMQPTWREFYQQGQNHRCLIRTTRLLPSHPFPTTARRRHAPLCRRPAAMPFIMTARCVSFFSAGSAPGNCNPPHHIFHSLIICLALDVRAFRFLFPFLRPYLFSGVPSNSQILLNEHESRRFHLALLLIKAHFFLLEACNFRFEFF